MNSAIDRTAAKDHMYVPEAAARLGMSTFTLRLAMRHGEIGYIRLGVGRGRIIFQQRHLDEYMRRREVAPTAA